MAKKRQNKELLIMTIEIGDGRKDTITIYHGSEPYQIAKEFCIKHDLDQSMIEILRTHIIANLQHPIVDQIQNQNAKDLLKSNQNYTENLQQQPNKYSYTKKYERQTKSSLKERKESPNKYINKTFDKSVRQNAVPKITYEPIKVFNNVKSARNGTNELSQGLINKKRQKSQSGNKLSNDRNYTEQIPSYSTFQSIQSTNNKFKRTESAQLQNDFGQRMYYTGVKALQEKDRKTEDFKKQQIQTEDKTLTFRPNLKNSKKSIQQLQMQNRDQPVEDLLTGKGKQTRQFIEKARTDKILEELKSCSFNPQVSKMAQKIHQKKQQNRSIDVYTNLYDQNKTKQEKQKELIQQITNLQCSFHPDIGVNKEIKRNESSSQFLERLMNSKNEMDTKIVQMRAQIEYDQCVIDPITENEYFKPQIHQKGAKGKEIFDYLYNQAQEKIEQEKQRQIMEQQKNKSIANQKLVKGTSEQISKQFQTKRIAEIFTTLDANRDGKIKKDNIEVGQLDPKILKVIKPLLENIEQNEQELDQKQFSNEMEKILKNISFAEKQIIFQKDYKYKSTEGKHSFQPNVYKEKNQLVKSQQNSLIQRLVQKNDKINEQIKQEQEKKILGELEKCTFKPTVNKIPKFIIERKKQLQEQKRNNQETDFINSNIQENEIFIKIQTN